MKINTVLSPQPSQPPSTFSEWIEAHRGIVANNAGAVISTLFGDSINPHGGTVCLGSIVQLCGSLGISEATTRSAVARMANDGFLESVLAGRRADYRQTDQGSPRMDLSMYRTYLALHDEWGEGKTWEFVVLHAHRFKNDAHAFGVASEALCSDGFGKLNDTVFVRPQREPNPYARPSALLPAGLEDAYTSFTGALAPDSPERSVEEMIGAMWDFPLLRSRYLGFVADTAALLDELWDRGSTITPAEAFVIRTYLIHDYRRIVAASPMLPVGLRARDSACAKARYMIREIYDFLVPASEEFLSSVLETTEGKVPPLDPSFFERFDGLTHAEG